MNLNLYEKTYDAHTNCFYYRYINRIDESYLPSINLAIVEEAETKRITLKIEPNDFFAVKNIFTIFWKAKNSNELGQLNYRKSGNVADYVFAAEINKFLSLDFELLYCGIKLFDKHKIDAFVNVFTDFHKMLAGETELQ